MDVAVPEQHLSELEVIRAVRDVRERGDQAAFSRLIRTYDSNLRSVAYGILRSQAAMDDALQEAYIKAYQSISQLDNAASFRFWLRRIVVTTCLDHLRSRERRKEVEYDEMPIEAPFQQFESRLELQNSLARAMNQLSDDHRILIELIDAQSMSYAEAGSLLKQKPGTIASRTSRARVRLRELLKKEGVTR